MSDRPAQSDLPKVEPDQSLAPGQPDSEIFNRTSPPAGTLPVMVWIVAGLIILAIVGGLLVAGRRHARPGPSAALSLDPYAASLPITDTEMSESSSLSGGKSTFVDGHIRNSGSRTITGITVQVFFANDEGMPPHIETLPMSLIRTRQPYVDSQTVAAAPLLPGDDRDFRLIFETLPGNWNTRLPEIRIVETTAR